MTRVRLVAFLLLIVAYYAFVVSAGRWTTWPTYTAYYDTQAEGFRAGHLYVALPVDPELVAAPNPLDPANFRHWRWDLSYYGGHFHLYWGLAPAAMLALVKTIFRIDQPVGDQVLVFVFLVGRAVAGTLLIRALARRWTPGPPAWAVWLASAVWVAANPTPFLLARAAIYEAAITAGGCFLAFGLYGAFESLGAADERGTVRLLALASLAFGLAAASRATLVPVAALLLAATLVGLRARGRRLVPAALAAAAPAGVVMALHFTANYLRFGSWAEFGVRYQMGFPFRLAARYVAPNLYLYLLHPLVTSCGFPFLHSRWEELRPTVPAWVPFPDDLRATEPTVGLLVAIPFVWLIVVAPLAWLVRAAPRLAEARFWRGVAIVLGLATALGTAPVLTMYTHSMRYEADLTWGPVLLATLAGWWALSAARPLRTLTAALYVGLAVASVAIGVLLGFEGYYGHFAQHNPALMARLVTWHVCR